MNDSKVPYKGLPTTSEAQLEAIANMGACEKTCCVDVDAFAKDPKLLQQLFGNFITQDVYLTFREKAVEHLQGEMESQKQLWFQYALEEIVDLMRGPMEPQETTNLRVL